MKMKTAAKGSKNETLPFRHEVYIALLRCSEFNCYLTKMKKVFAKGIIIGRDTTVIDVGHEFRVSQHPPKKHTIDRYR